MFDGMSFLEFDKDGVRDAEAHYIGILNPILNRRGKLNPEAHLSWKPKPKPSPGGDAFGCHGKKNKEVNRHLSSFPQTAEQFADATGFTESYIKAHLSAMIQDGKVIEERDSNGIIMGYRVRPGLFEASE
jgi:hypothetical protein